MENNSDIASQELIDRAYSSIVSHISGDEGQSVLILGPELAVNKSGTGYKSYFKELANKKTNRIDNYFESENLFSFADEAAEQYALPMVKEFYSNCGDPVLLDMIARIKFPLIINLCPDVALYKVYEQKYTKPESGYFTKGSYLKFKDLPEPTKDKPVIYNIFGSVANDSSLILTHNKLYETIDYLLREGSLPPAIQIFLDNASSFILLGVRFDSWYYQLICYRLKLKDGNKKSINLKTIDKDDKSPGGMVLQKNFGLLFTIDNPVQTIERIIEQCKNNPDALREKDSKGAYSIFVSYAWRDKSASKKEVCRDTPIDYLVDYSALKQEVALQIFRDCDDLDYGDSIESFMTRIGKGKTVIRVISDKYLLSDYCMIEALLMSNYKAGGKRIFTILWEDAELGNEKKYKDFWKKKCVDGLEKTDEASAKKNEMYVKIYGFIGSFIQGLVDEKRLDVKKDDFIVDEAAGEVSLKTESREQVEGFVAKIIKKLKEQ